MLNSILQKIFYSYFCPPDIPIKGTFKYDELFRIVQEKTGVTPYLLDNIYNYTTYTGMCRLVQEYVRKHSFVSEIYDCDDFAIDFLAYMHHPKTSGIAGGIAFSIYHAYNIMVVEGGEVYIIEPQSKASWKQPKPYSEGIYKTNRIII